MLKRVLDNGPVIALLILVAGITAWMLLAFVPALILSKGWVNAGDLEKLGQIGDLFGSSNALFSGLAMFAAIYAVIQGQREYKLTRDEMKRSADAQTAAVIEQKRLIDAQMMLAILNDFPPNRSEEASRKLMKFKHEFLELDDKGEFTDTFEAFLKQAQTIEVSFGKTLFQQRVGEIESEIDLIVSGFDRVYRMFQHGIIDETVIKAAIPYGAAVALVFVISPIDQASGEYRAIKFTGLFRRIFDVKDPGEPLDWLEDAEKDDN